MRKAFGICGLLMFVAWVVNLARITYRDLHTPELWEVDRRTDPRSYLPVCLLLMGIMVYQLARELWPLWRRWQILKTIKTVLDLLQEGRVRDADRLFDRARERYRTMYRRELDPDPLRAFFAYAKQFDRELERERNQSG